MFLDVRLVVLALAPAIALTIALAIAIAITAAITRRYGLLILQHILDSIACHAINLNVAPAISQLPAPFT
jgi:hypothetical protein